MATVLKMIDYHTGSSPISWGRSRRTKPVPVGTIYFIGPEAGMVKIGFTTDLATRLKRLQMGSPVPLFVIATTEGPMTLEREYHARFKSARAHGEWFLRTIDVDEEIEKLRAPTPFGHIERN